jgi:hypothetical protein
MFARSKTQKIGLSFLSQIKEFVLFNHLKDAENVLSTLS